MRMRKIHKKLLDFSYTFFFLTLGETGRGKEPLTKLLLYAYAGCLDGWTMDGRTLPTHTHTKEGAYTHTHATHWDILAHTGTHNRGKLGRNIFKAIFLMRYRLMVCCLSLPRDEHSQQEVTEAALLVAGSAGRCTWNCLHIKYTHNVYALGKLPLIKQLAMGRIY